MSGIETIVGLDACIFCKDAIRDGLVGEVEGELLRNFNFCAILSNEIEVDKCRIIAEFQLEESFHS